MGVFGVSCPDSQWIPNAPYVVDAAPIGLLTLRFQPRLMRVLDEIPETNTKPRRIQQEIFATALLEKNLLVAGTSSVHREALADGSAVQHVVGRSMSLVHWIQIANPLAEG